MVVLVVDLCLGCLDCKFGGETAGGFGLIL